MIPVDAFSSNRMQVLPISKFNIHMVGLLKCLRNIKRFMFISTIVDTHFMFMWHEEFLIFEPLYKFNTFVKKDIL